MNTFLSNFLDVAEFSIWQRAAIVIVAAGCIHLVVTGIRLASTRAMASRIAEHITKTRTVISLASSTLIFFLYFAAFGIALNEFGVSLTTYFASASIIGLAVAFGSQGLVQDVVSGLTVVFANLYDIGSIVEVGGQVGVVESFGMRYTTLRNPLGASVYVPNRSVTNIVVYPRGYVRCFVDCVVPEEPEKAEAFKILIREMTDTAYEQYPGILRAPAEINGPLRTRANKQYIRLKFRIWPGRGGPLEGVFRQDLLQAIRRIEPDYPDWKVSVNYEIEKYSPPKRTRKRAKGN